MVCGGFSDSTNDSILDNFKTLYLVNGYIREQRVAIVKFGMDCGVQRQ